MAVRLGDVVPKLLATQLDLKRCPHCNVDTPTLAWVGWQLESGNFDNSRKRYWRSYRCARCGGVVTGAAPGWDHEATELYPSGTDIDGAIPERARAYLDQAVNSLNSPAGAVMLAASAVDAMLKAKNLKDGSLFARIDQAAANHLITPEMAAWAHEVRLDANDQRHADEAVALPAPVDAKRAVDFALALAQFMFVLPARVQRGIADAKTQQQ